jgi:hypothetical protein
MTDLKPFKPCPFCGKESGRYGWVMLAELNKVKCNYCGAESRSGDGPEAWNTRPIEDKLKDRVRELEDAAKKAANYYCPPMRNSHGRECPLCEVFRALLAKGDAREAPQK